MADAVRIELRSGSAAYPVLVGPGAIRQLPALLNERGLLGKLRIVADEQLAARYGEPLLDALSAAGRSAALLAISGRESDKNLTAVARVYDWLVEIGTDRRDVLLALGGGVVGDLAGFVAATFLRGVRLVQLPTTVLAMVDSSIGGKTGVDHPGGKNLIGAFHQPSLVVAELEYLASLPRRERAAGWAEVIKMGLVCSAELFERLEAAPGAMLGLGSEAVWAIARSIELKGEVVAADERESDRRMILNYGHTIGHAIEAATGFGRYLHGEAVAIGMAGAADIAVRLGRLAPQGQRRQAALLERFGLPQRCSGLDPAALWAPMRRDKKALGARLRWVLPDEIGRGSIVESVPEPVVAAVLEQLVRDRDAAQPRAAAPPSAISL